MTQKDNAVRNSKDCFLYGHTILTHQLEARLVLPNFLNIFFFFFIINLEKKFLKLTKNKFFLIKKFLNQVLHNLKFPAVFLGNKDTYPSDDCILQRR